MAGEIDVFKDGSLALVTVWVLKDLYNSAKGAFTSPKANETHQTTTVNANGANGNGTAAAALSAFHIEKSLDRVANASDKLAETLTELLVESKEHTLLLRDMKKSDESRDEREVRRSQYWESKWDKDLKKE